MKLKNKIFEARDIAHKHKLDERERERGTRSYDQLHSKSM